ncbi:arginase family protein [Hoeflea ulvae]|uniref:Arginase family protein n=1 Tax=Hoeflea ulvae TaxID=2983764 RepID=A0ABT3YKJ4_9HYPH|nr:arginase family protein [Hoeflea ulvae]MCY0096411.1 arginase family protein [Hoeflea ulvae]
MDDTHALDDQRYRLNPRLRLTQYGGAFYAHDAALAQEPMVHIATQRIAEADFATLRALKGQGLFIEPETMSSLKAAVLALDADAAALDRWIKARFLLSHTSPAQQVEARLLQRLSDDFAAMPQRREFSDLETNQRFFAPNTFFNLPRDVDPSRAHVGMIGLPFASLPVSAGTQTAPEALRLQSRAVSWLDLHKNGAYSDIVLSGGRPGVIGRGIVVQDCGDLQSPDGTPCGMLGALEMLLDRLADDTIRPLFVGGDHAVTYPVIKAMLAREPRLGLLHFDAHNDLFYQDAISYNHAAFLSNLIRDTDIETVVSLGLRTALDQRTQVMDRAYASHGVGARVTLLPLMRLKQLLASPAALSEAIAALAGRPYYITLDLDVMSETAIAGQVSTPCGAGLEWHELHTLLQAMFAHLDICGADVVEFNPGNGKAGGAARAVNAMLVHLIDGLARSDGKPPAPARDEQDDAPSDRP